MKTLITLLGRTAKGGYSPANYRFPDGDTRKAAFLGWPLMERLGPERVIVLGTETSVWDHLFEGDLDLGDAGENRRLALIEKVAAQAPVDQGLLDELAPVLEQALGRQIRLVIIPEGVDADDQMRMFETLDQHVPDGCELHVDCTHGFRHMPMILLAAAQFLAGMARATIAKIYYGKYDPATDLAPVYELEGLTRLQAGVTALAIYDRSGDFEPLLDFLDPYLPEKIDRDELREAAFQERMLRITRARKPFQKLHRLLTATELGFPARLLQRALSDRIAWANESHHYKRQIMVARRTLAHGDHVRTAALLYEAVINHVVHKHGLGDAEQREARERARDVLHDELRDRSLLPSFNLLNRVRNSLLHAVRPEGADAQSLVDSRQRLDEFLGRTADEIEGFINP